MGMMAMWVKAAAHVLPYPIPSPLFPLFPFPLPPSRSLLQSFMEMLAMEMKAEGKYVARGLSYK